MPYITAARLPDLLRPIINARLTGGRLRPYVHVHAAWAGDWWGGERVHYPDCDIRDLTPEGIERFWDCGCELVPWANIMRVEIGGHVEGANGFPQRTAPVAYHIIGTAAQQAELRASERSYVPFGMSHPDAGRGFRVGGAA